MAASSCLWIPLSGANSTELVMTKYFPKIPASSIPKGLDAIYSSCLKLYPTQQNPLQVSSKPKRWLNGQYPLDFVNMYFNAGEEALGVSEHWHYISLGLSDLYGDGRSYQRFRDKDGLTIPSGFGFELTFRLKKESRDVVPPSWPALLLQGVAHYVFECDKLMPGDYIYYATPLDGTSSSILKHVLIVEDPQLEEIVSSAETGGQWHVTDVKRKQSIFEILPTGRQTLAQGIANDGSNLLGVNASVIWQELCGNDLPGSPYVWKQRISSASVMNGNSDETEKFLRGVSIVFDRQNGVLLPLVLRGRILHGRHFTFKNHGDRA